MPTPRRWLERPDGDVRASHAERDDVLQALIVHWSDGRLDEATFDQRAARARAAVTRRDLDLLLRDLPPLATPLPPPRRPSPLGRRRRAHRMGVVRTTVLVLALVVVLQSLAGAMGDAVQRVPWLAVAVVAWLVVRHRTARGGRHHLRA